MRACALGLLGAAMVVGDASAAVLWSNGDPNTSSAYATIDLQYPSLFIVSLDDVTVPAGQDWQVKTLFGHFYFREDEAPFAGQTAAWQIRTGVSDNVPGSSALDGFGAIAASNTAFTAVSNGMDAGFGYKGYRLEVDVSSRNITLAAGQTYHIQIAPYQPVPWTGEMYIAQTNGANSVNAPPGNNAILNGPAYGLNFKQQTYSVAYGLTGDAVALVPEPVAVGTVVIGATMMVLRRRRV